MTCSESTGIGPVFDPATALGWRDVALDGLSCYLRCVEAVLAASGYGAADVADALACPLRLIEDDSSGRPRGDYRACTVEWRQVPSGQSLWEFLVSVLARGDYAVLSPDSFWWPGDELQGKVHGHHHMVLPISLVGGVLEYLDTDAPADAGFRARQAESERLRMSVNTVGVVRILRHDTALGSLRESWQDVVRESATRLATDIAEFQLLARQWREVPPTPMIARALHVLVLGEVQPPLFLFASALDGEPRLSHVVHDAFEAARQAKKLGILLTGLHRFDSSALYQICLGELEALCRSLANLVESLSAAAATRDLVSAPAPPTSRSGTLAQRLSGLLRWCFDQDGQAAIEWLGAS